MPKITATHLLALHTAKRWLKREDVIAVGVGLRMRFGKLTEEPSVVVTVRWKRKPERLKELGLKPLPKHIRVRVGAKIHLVPVDIQGAGGRKRGRHHGLVGCVLDNATQQISGMLGGVVLRNGTRFMLTAAHVARSQGTAINVHGPNGILNGTTIEVHLGDNLDHALIEPDDRLSSGSGSLAGGQALLGIRAVSTLKLGDPARFQARNGAECLVAVVKAHETVPFKMPGGEVIFTNAVATDLQSHAGDSGTLLYDDKFLAVGTLIGEFLRYSYFLPCEPSFADLDLVLG